MILPGDVNFVGTLYSLGATLSFTSRTRRSCACAWRTAATSSSRTAPGRTCGSAASSWPLFAFLGGARDGSLVPRPRRPEPARRAGSGSAGWSPGSPATSSTGVGSSTYRCARSRRRRPRSGLRSRSSTATCSCLSSPGQPSDAAMDVACRLAAERRARIVALSVARGPARPGVDRPLSRSWRRRRTASSTRQRRSATRTASVSSRASSARTRPALRSWPRPTRGTPRSSSSARRGGTSPRGSRRSSGRPSTTSSSTRPAACS